MGHVTLYLEDDVARKMRDAAKSMNISQRRWVAELIKEKISNEWPDSIKQLAGAWSDLSLTEAIITKSAQDTVTIA